MSTTVLKPKREKSNASQTNLPRQIASKMVLTNLQTAVGGDGPDADWFEFTRKMPLYDLLQAVTARRKKLKELSKKRINQLPPADKEMFLSIIDDVEHVDLIYEAANNQWLKTMGKYCKEEGGSSMGSIVESVFGTLPCPPASAAPDPSSEESRKCSILVIHWDQSGGKGPQAQVEIVNLTTSVFNEIAPKFNPVKTAEEEQSMKKANIPIPIAVEKVCPIAPQQDQTAKSAHIGKYFEKLSASVQRRASVDTENPPTTQTIKGKRVNPIKIIKIVEPTKPAVAANTKNQIQTPPVPKTIAQQQKIATSKSLNCLRRSSAAQPVNFQRRLSSTQTASIVPNPKATGAQLKR